MRPKKYVVAGIAAAAFLGCAESTTTDPSGMLVDVGTVRVTLQRASVGISPLLTAVETGAAKPVSADNVASLLVEITAIHFLPVGVEDMEGGNGEENGEGDASDGDGDGWIRLTLDEPVVVDLQLLPSEGDSPLVVASGSVEAGDYRKARFIVGAATIVFSEAVAIGQAFTYEADTDYDVTVPSGAQTGLKTDVTFSVAADDDSDVPILFEPETTFRKINVTGNGKVMLAPVLKAR